MRLAKKPPRRARELPDPIISERVTAYDREDNVISE